MDNPYPDNLDLHVKIMNQIYRFVNGPERQPEHGEFDIFRGQEYLDNSKADPTGAITKEEGGEDEKSSES